MKTITEEEKIALYEKHDSQLDELLTKDSKFIYTGGGKRILVDADENIPSIRVRIRKSYIEVTVRIFKNGSESNKSIGRYILGIENILLLIDHINNNPLDNRRCNLRVCSQSENLMNRGKISKKNKYKGYTLGKKGSVVECSKEGYRKNIKIYGEVTEEKLAFIYDCMALDMHGDFAHLNFPKENYTNKLVSDTLDFYKKDTEGYQKYICNGRVSEGSRDYWRERCELAEKALTIGTTLDFTCADGWIESRKAREEWEDFIKTSEQS